jgi:hypothetical protein
VCKTLSVIRQLISNVSTPPIPFVSALGRESWGSERIHDDIFAPSAIEFEWIFSNDLASNLLVS